MHRRAYLASLAGGMSLLAGCAASASDRYQDVVDPDPSVSEAGLASETRDVDPLDVDESMVESYMAQNDAQTIVKMVPLEVANYWHATRKARFIDARIEAQYEEHHIEGAAFSPAPHGTDGNDPVAAWPTNERIVAYCTCPHHLSGIRAGNLLAEGYTGAYILAPGMQPWAEQGLPTGGTVEQKTEFVDDYSRVEDE